jgi:hypothetical protein
MNENRMGKTEGERRTKLESVKRSLENKGKASTVDNEFPPKFLEPLVLDGQRLHLIEPGRVVFSMKIPPRLLVRTQYPTYYSLLLLFDDFCYCLIRRIQVITCTLVRSLLWWIW